MNKNHSFENHQISVIRYKKVIDVSQVNIYYNTA